MGGGLNPAARGFSSVAVLAAVVAAAGCGSQRHSHKAQVPSDAEVRHVAKLTRLQQLAGRRFGLSRYGGIWEEHHDSAPVVLGVARPTDIELRAGDALIASTGLRGRTVGVTVGWADLLRLNSRVAALLPRANFGALHVITAGIRPDLNALELAVPPPPFMTPRQRFFLRREAWGHTANLRVIEEPQVPSLLLCSGVFCSPPLRAGINVFDRVVGCTGAFIVRLMSTGGLYQVTAGHCQGLIPRIWLTEFPNRTVHSIGPMSIRRFGPALDAGLIRVNNPAGWRPRAWVAVRRGPGVGASDEDYPIWGVGTAVPGMRVCMSSGARPWSNCGVVTKIGVTVSYTEAKRTVSGLTQASICAQAGDSGSPVFAGHVAFGIVSGSGGRCLTWFQPVVPAARALGARVAVDRR